MEATEERNNLFLVLDSKGRQQSWVRCGGQVRLLLELVASQEIRPSSIASQQDNVTIFMRLGAAKAA
jgi:hypothetical protein